jgi:hypothetical protein
VRRPLFLQVGVGKLSGPARLNAAAAGQLLYVTDQQSSRRFLVDSGASVSLIPHSSPSPSSGPRLVGPDGGDIACWGERELQLQLGGLPFTWKFLRAAVAFPILGLDFLKANSLLLDATDAQLVHKPSGTAVPLCRRASGPNAAIILSPCNGQVLSTFIAGKAVPGGLERVPSSVQEAAAAVKRPPGVGGAAQRVQSIQQLLTAFPDVLNPSKRLPATKHGVVHHLRTQGPPIASSTPRSWPPPRRSLQRWNETVL